VVKLVYYPEEKKHFVGIGAIAGIRIYGNQLAD
jgi:hypothetical protein